MDAIKAQLNRDGRPGRFVLTGSTRHDALPSAAQALTGRLSRLTVRPFSQAETTGTSGLLGALFGDPAAVVAERTLSTSTREDYVARVVAGGFPLARAQRTAAARAGGSTNTWRSPWSGTSAN